MDVRIVTFPATRGACLIHLNVGPAVREAEAITDVYLRGLGEPGPG